MPPNVDVQHFGARSPKADPSFPLQGRPKMIYLDNGPVAKRRVFQNVMQALDIEWQTHIPAGRQGWHTHYDPLEGQG